MKTQVIIRGNEVKWVDSPAATRWLAPALGAADSKRATWIEPVNPALRLAFLAIRRLVARRSRLAAWTRRWPCRWRARILADGRVFGPFAKRQDAIDAEVSVLVEMLARPRARTVRAESRRAVLIVELVAYLAFLAATVAACALW